MSVSEEGALIKEEKEEGGGNEEMC